MPNVIVRNVIAICFNLLNEMFHMDSIEEKLLTFQGNFVISWQWQKMIRFLVLANRMLAYYWKIAEIVRMSFGFGQFYEFDGENGYIPFSTKKSLYSRIFGDYSNIYGVGLIIASLEYVFQPNLFRLTSGTIYKS